MGLIWTKILIALRGRGHDVSDAIMPQQALRILDHELLDARDLVDAGRSGLANLITKHILATREAEQTARRLADMTDNARKALALGHHSLALELAAHIGRLEQVQAEDERVALQYAKNVDTLRLSLQSDENALCTLKRQIDALRTLETKRASSSACDSGSRFQAAADALDAICQRQRDMAAHLELQNRLCLRDPHLERQLREPVVIPDESSAHAVLARINAIAQQSLPCREHL